MKNRFIINLISNIVSFILQLGISFIITPIITERLGDAAYGFIGLANNFVNYASIFTVVINSMASRFVTVELLKDNKQKANQYFSSVLLMDIIMSIIIAISSIFIIVNLELLLDIPENLIFDVKLTFTLAFINLMISVMNTVFSIATFAKNRLDLSAISTIISSIIKAVLLVVLFSIFTPKIYYITLTTIIYSVLLIVLNYKFTKKLTPELEITVKNYNKQSTIDIIKSGMWNSINSLGRTLLTGLDLLIANIYLGPDAMGLISISKTIPTSIESLISTIANIFAPKFVYYYSKNKIRDLVKYVNFSLKIITFLMCVPMAGFLVFGTDFFSLWLPSKSLEEVQLIQVLSILALLPYCISFGVFSVSILDTVTNKLKRPVLMTLLISILSTITTIVALKVSNLGIYAVAGASSIYWCVKVFFFNTINAAKNLRLKWYTFYPQYLKDLFVFVIILIIFIIMKQFIYIETWINLIMWIGIFAIIGYIITYLILFNKEDKKFFKDKIYNTIMKNRID